jgi:NAD-dependent deacetylase
MPKTKIVFFTGAGVSAESGLATFRDSEDGLWNNYHIEDVCTPEAWERNNELVLEFYNLRRNQCHEAKPNLAHYLMAELEDHFDVTLITQNVDNLHERAGSRNIIHLHGELMKSRSTSDESLIYDQLEDIRIGDYCEKGSQLRPNIVWFGESLDESKMNAAIERIKECQVCVIVGTSLTVSPANMIPFYLRKSAKLIVIDPNEVNLDFLEAEDYFHLKTTATEGMQQVVESLTKNIS